MNIKQRIARLENGGTAQAPTIEELTDLDRQRRIELLFREANERPDDAGLVRRSTAIHQLLEAWA